MGTPLAIVIGAAIIAAAILVTNHWQIMRTQEALVVVRLNRWTGRIEMCMADLGATPSPKTLAGIQLPCRPE
jgi:hypothetical protein